MRIALGIEYDGRPFSGWQRQPHASSVQQVLETALSGVAAEPVSVVAAGRTDRGVHALAQVVHFDTTAHRPLTAWIRGSNALLPPEVAVLWAREVPETFHARFSAHFRSYDYFLLNHPVRPALMQGLWGWHHQPLILETMRQGASRLLGEHDFSAFRAAECQAKTPVKCLHEVRIDQQGQRFRFFFKADAVLHHMVRNMVGAPVAVGAGRHEPEWIARLLSSRDRTCAAPTFSPEGLYLKEVGYAPEWNLPVVPVRWPVVFAVNGDIDEDTHQDLWAHPTR